MYVMYDEYLYEYRKKREVSIQERENRREPGRASRTGRASMAWERMHVYEYMFADGGSAGDATGAGKNVLRTLDITGSNVTRSRRERERPAFRGAKRRGEQRVEGARWVSRLLTITIDLVLFYTRAAHYSNLFKSMPPRAIGRRERWFLIGFRHAADRLKLFERTSWHRAGRSIDDERALSSAINACIVLMRKGTRRTNSPATFRGRRWTVNRVKGLINLHANLRRRICCRYDDPLLGPYMVESFAVLLGMRWYLQRDASKCSLYHCDIIRHRVTDSLIRIHPVKRSFIYFHFSRVDGKGTA